jgi:hypothetical protein
MDKLQAAIAAKDTATIKGALGHLVEHLEDGGTLTADERLVHARLCEELENRHPQIAADLDAWMEQDEPEIPFYGRVILNLI